MSSPSEAEHSDISPPESVCSPAVIRPELLEKLSETQRNRLQDLCDAFKRCIEGKDWTVDHFMEFPDNLNVNEMLGIVEGDPSHKIYKDSFDKAKEDLRTRLKKEHAPDTQISDETLDKTLLLLVGVAKWMFQSLKKELGDGVDAQREWRDSIIKASDVEDPKTNWDPFWPEPPAANPKTEVISFD